MRPPHRRAALSGLLAATWQAPAHAAPPVYAEVEPGEAISFPRDHGAHPEFRTEWWYVTGWLDAKPQPIGFQVTFFRSRPPVDQANPSAFAARQVLLAHAALSDPSVGRLLHDQRVAREGFGLARASTRDTDIVLDDWSLRRRPDGRFVARIVSNEFAFDLVFEPTQPVLLQGLEGYSRKGPAPKQASRYYTLPQLAVSGTVRRGRR
ncbi:carotenoid 1,2-hydratase, partial [Phenylobacterium sp.]|uniref:carotenoid 1,2-hydratase n=1 Tax=Phenylobacterium sp. TaxID=1871053 RepID=UPI002734604C